MFKRQSLLVRIVLLLFFSTILCHSPAISQSMPAFKMQLTNGKLFSSAELSHQKPLIIIYFAPDCEHCQILMNEVFKKITEFKTAQILMVTFEPLKEVIGFEKKYQTAKYSNIKVGSEVPVFFFRTFYHLEHTPFTALFNKNGQLVASYKDQTPVDDLIKRLKKLK